MRRLLGFAAAACAAASFSIMWPAHSRAASESPCGPVLRGPDLPEPPRLTSTDGVLSVRMTALADPDVPVGQLRYCYRFAAVVDGARRTGVVPPTLAVHPGDRIIFDLVNDLPKTGAGMPMALPHAPFSRPDARPTREPGSTHSLTNYLNVHFHGLNVSPLLPSDDVVDVSLPPASHASFRYVIDIPKNEPGGLYWYHPHVHGESKLAVKAGLTGAILIVPTGYEKTDSRVVVIRGSDWEAPPIALARRRAKRASQAALTAASTARNGLVRTASDRRDFPFAPPAECPAFGGDPPDAEFLSVNGMAVPEMNQADTPLPQAHIEEGEAQVWHIANTAAISYVDLALRVDGKRVPLHVVGRDGIPVGRDNGNVEYRPLDLPHVPLPTAGRVDVLLTGPKAGHTAVLSTLPVDTGCAGDKDGARDLVAITGTPEDRTNAARSLPALTAATFTTRRNSRFANLDAAKPSRARRFVLTEYPLDDGSRTDFYVTELSNPAAYERPYHMFDPPAVTVKSGTTEDWTVENWTQELHAFHIHQIHFKVLSGVPQTEGLGMLLDTIDIPYGSYVTAGGKRRFVPGAVRLRMDFRDPQIVGTFVYHCHILEHEDNGMMAKIRVVP